jgi:putative coproporphyrinogen dehydrogenase
LNEQIEEEMFLGLRLLEGVDLIYFEEKYGKKVQDIFKDVVERNINDGYLEIVDNKLRLTCKGLFYGNDVFSEFLLN